MAAAYFWMRGFRYISYYRGAFLEGVERSQVALPGRNLDELSREFALHELRTLALLAAITTGPISEWPRAVALEDYASFRDFLRGLPPDEGLIIVVPHIGPSTLVAHLCYSAIRRPAAAIIGKELVGAFREWGAAANWPDYEIISVPEAWSLKHAVTSLRSGKILYVLPDINIAIKDPDRLVRTSSGIAVAGRTIATLHRHSRAAVMVAAIVRDGFGRWRLLLDSIVEATSGRDGRPNESVLQPTIEDKIAGSLSRIIQTYPEQSHYWISNRWGD